jgi:hypothetical protein
MAGARDISEVISSTTARILDAQPSAPVQLRIDRDVLGDDDLADKTLVCGIPESHPARRMLRKVAFRESDIWMKTDVGGCVRGGVDDAFRAALNAGLTTADPLIQDPMAVGLRCPAQRFRVGHPRKGLRAMARQASRP